MAKDKVDPDKDHKEASAKKSTRKTVVTDTTTEDTTDHKDHKHGSTNLLAIVVMAAVVLIVGIVAYNIANERGAFATSVASSCPDDYTKREYKSREVVNPKSCQLRWVVHSGCVNWYDRSGALLRKTCANARATINDQYALEPVDGPAEVSINHCPLNATGSQLEVCR